MSECKIIKHGADTKNTNYTVSQKPDPYDLYYITLLIHDIFLAKTGLIQFAIDTVKKFLNWLNTNCVVSIKMFLDSPSIAALHFGG